MPTSVSAVTPIYGEYAAFYDRSGQTWFAILMNTYLRDVLRRHPAPGHRLLDLACGTGSLAVLLAESGWEVIGLDASAGMLEQARKKARDGERNLQFIEGDMRKIDLSVPVDLVTCCYDSLNYLLSDDDLLACFQSVRASLVPDGLFCFDLATDHFLEAYWQGEQRYQDDEYSQVMQSWFDPATRLSSLVLHGSFRRAGELPHEFSEIHVERAFAVERVRELLEHAGLVFEALYDCFTFQPPSPLSLRQFWVARALR